MQKPANKQFTIECDTQGRGLYSLAALLPEHLPSHGRGICHLFVCHTSASLLITENADPEVHHDLERFFARLVPDGDPIFRHDDEGPDDMPAHVRSVLTQTALSIPVANGKPMLGTWQGVYLWEHRTAPHRRRVIVTFLPANGEHDQ